MGVVRAEAKVGTGEQAGNVSVGLQVFEGASFPLQDVC